MKKKLISIILLTILIIIYMYTLVINYFPEKIIIFEGESILTKPFLGLNISSQGVTLTVSSNPSEQTINKIGTEKLKLNLFNNFTVKDIDVSVIPKTKVIPVGNIAGVKLYTNGVLVVRNVRNRRRR